MTVPRLLSLTEHWRSNPPLHKMVAAYLGVKAEAPKKEEQEAGEEADKEADKEAQLMQFAEAFRSLNG